MLLHFPVTKVAGFLRKELPSAPLSKISDLFSPREFFFDCLLNILVAIHFGFASRILLIICDRDMDYRFRVSSLGESENRA